jgi:hypothetical protein
MTDSCDTGQPPSSRRALARINPHNAPDSDAKSRQYPDAEPVQILHWALSLSITFRTTLPSPPTLGPHFAALHGIACPPSCPFPVRSSRDWCRKAVLPADAGTHVIRQYAKLPSTRSRYVRAPLHSCAWSRTVPREALVCKLCGCAMTYPARSADGRGCRQGAPFGGGLAGAPDVRSSGRPWRRLALSSGSCAGRAG